MRLSGSENRPLTRISSLSIALVVLFGDSMHELFPSVSSQMFKIVGYFV